MSHMLKLLGRADCVGAGLEAEKLARACGWGETEAGEAKLLVVELCSNAVRYAQDGICALKIDEAHIEVTVEDKGPGLPQWVLDGEPANGRRGGLGEGIACARRLSNELMLMNRPGGGARVFARRDRRRPPEQGSVHG